MIIDSHEHVMFPTEKQLSKMDSAGVDKAILFCSAPHPERARSLNEIEAEMSMLYKRLAGGYTKEADIVSQKQNIEELTGVMKAYPDRFYGFGPVPLGMSLKETMDWIRDFILSQSLLGVGEFTPGNEKQMGQLETVFEALESTAICPLWVHTFEPVSLGGLKILMGLCEKHPNVPVIFGHLGGMHWIETIRFAKSHKNAYLDLSAAFASIATKMALIELPERCLFSSDAPYGEPHLYRQLIEFMSPSKEIATLALGGNIEKLLHLQ